MTTVESKRTIEILVGALFLLAILFYGSGNGILESIVNSENFLSTIFHNKSKFVTSLILMLSNSVVVLSIGVLMFPILELQSKITARIYLVVRIVEGILLSVGVIQLFLLLILSDEHMKSPQNLQYTVLANLFRKGNFFSYQIAMASLGIGSLFFCFHLFKSKLIPRLLSLWAFVGYALLAFGSIAELYGYEIGLVLCIPGGIFEMVLPFWLFIKGFNVDVKPVE
jgi:hypothetical protein